MNSCLRIRKPRLNSNWQLKEPEYDKEFPTVQEMQFSLLTGWKGLSGEAIRAAS
jgi:hypothetical protein